MTPDENSLETTRLFVASQAEEVLQRPGVGAVVTMVSILGEDGTTSFVRYQAGNIHACEGLLREKLRELEQYENGFHFERGRYEQVTHRQARQARDQSRPKDGDEWKSQ